MKNLKVKEMKEMAEELDMSPDWQKTLDSNRAS